MEPRISDDQCVAVGDAKRSERHSVLDCFPSVIDEGGGRSTVFNYTSPLAGADLPWIAGQVGRTEIYQVDLDIHEAHGDAAPIE